jgi:hypothetical protein
MQPAMAAPVVEDHRHPAGLGPPRLKFPVRIAAIRRLSSLGTLRHSFRMSE